MNRRGDKIDENPAMQHMTTDKWQAEVMSRGDDRFVDVRFLCPRCGNALTPANFIAVGASTVTAILDAIPGAWEQTQEGLADVKANRVVELDQI